MLRLNDDDLVGMGGVREEEGKEETDAAATCYHYRKVIDVVWFFRDHCLVGMVVTGGIGKELRFAIDL